MLLTITNLINYILGLNIPFLAITTLIIIVYIYVIYNYQSNILDNKILLITLIILLIIDLFAIYYIQFYSPKNINSIIAVSYTHLTLPTIYSV